MTVNFCSVGTDPAAEKTAGCLAANFGEVSLRCDCLTGSVEFAKIGHCSDTEAR